MKVADIMSKHVDYVPSNESVKEVCRLIFGRGINGVPVCKEKKVIGFITERDILSKLFPSVQEYIEDPFREGNFEGMEKKVLDIFLLPAEKIMSKNPATILAQAPVLQAQSLMTIHKIGRLPIVDKKGNLIGIISKGDIFRAVVGDNIPFAADEEYHDWLSKHYDLVVKWQERLGNEIPDLVRLLKEQKMHSVVDIGCGTGEHDIVLAREGFRTVGLENSKLMHRSAERKRELLPDDMKAKVEFINGNYVDMLRERSGEFDTAVFLGNAFAHLGKNYKKVLSETVKALSQKHACLIFQTINFEKVFKVKKRFLDMNFARSELGIEYEHGFLEFYTPSKKNNDMFTLTMAIFDFDGKKWKSRSMNSTQIAPLYKEDMESLLKAHGFKNISFYGSQFLGPLFKEPFRLLESDWLNIVAKR